MTADERIMVYFDEENKELYEYVCKHKNKLGFIRECLRAKMEKEKDLKETIIEALKDVLQQGNVSIVSVEQDEKQGDMGDIVGFFDEY